jgi:hypothetical protein
VAIWQTSALQAKDRKSGNVVALKLYRMHKLNEISSHQVAREVSQQLSCTVWLMLSEQP